MHVFLTGASGWVGSAVARELIAAGHTVTGLVRTLTKADAARGLGVTPRLGELGDLQGLRAAADQADAVIHTAFGIDFARIAELAEEDRRAIETFGEALQGSGRPLLVTGGFGLLPGGEGVRETARPAPIPNFPRVSEQTAFALADRGVHASVVRLPRSVHGKGETHGFVPMLAAFAKAQGVSAYVGEGDNLWPSVHRLDAARVYLRAVERGARGEAFHAVAEEGVPYRRIAEAIGRQVGVPARSMAPEAAAGHFGPFASWVAGNGPASSAWTRETLCWSPREPDLISDIERPDYSA